MSGGCIQSMKRRTLTTTIEEIKHKTPQGMYFMFNYKRATKRHAKRKKILLNNLHKCHIL